MVWSDCWENYCEYFFYFGGITDIICHPSYSMTGATRDGFPILLIGIIHLSTEERHWSKWSASALFTIYHYYPYTSFITCGSVFPLFVHLANRSHILPFKAVCCPLLRITVPKTLLFVKTYICLFQRESPRSQLCYFKSLNLNQPVLSGCLIKEKAMQMAHICLRYTAFPNRPTGGQSVLAYFFKEFFCLLHFSKYFLSR